MELLIKIDFESAKRFVSKLHKDDFIYDEATTFVAEALIFEKLGNQEMYEQAVSALHHLIWVTYN